MINQMGDLKLYKAWQIAADDLKIKIQFPAYNFGEGFGILIEDFGSSKGTIATGLETEIDFKSIKKDGLFISQLGSSYEKYNRVDFIETLNDWGYFGNNENIPDWYSGKPWTE